MTDIIIGPQIVNSVIRFEMQCDHIVNIAIFKGGFITVDIVRILLTDHLHIFK